MDERNKYREMIALRKEKESIMLGILELEKIDFAVIINSYILDSRKGYWRSKRKLSEQIKHSQSWKAIC